MTDTADIAIQPALDLGLPEYRGRTPTTMKSSVNGTGNRITTAHEIGETVVLVVEAKVKHAGHGETDKDGLVYAEKYKVVDLFEVSGKPGRRLLSGLRSSYRLADDKANGRKALPLEKTGAIVTPAGWTDENGRPLDDDELAEIRGDPILSSLGDESRDPVVLVLADGSRKVWPDDFGDDVPARPVVGEMVGDAGRVRQVLDVDTGETLGEWTDEQEDARLAALEAEALREEAAEDRAAIDDLERGRDSEIVVTADHTNEQPGFASGFCSSCGRAVGEKHLKACTFVMTGTAPPDGELEVDADEVPEVSNVVAGSFGPPWEGYDSLKIPDIKAKLGEMADREAVLAVGVYEERHKSRAGVLEAVNRRAAELFSGDVPRAELEGSPSGFEVPPDAIEDEDDFDDMQARRFAEADGSGGDDE